MAAKPVAASIQDIAASCGISRRTVSAILFPSDKNQHIGFSDTTRDQVLAAATKLRYRPNRASRNILVHRHGMIGILTGQFYMIPWPSLHGMLIAAQTYDQVLSLEYQAPGQEGLPLFIRDNVVDGLIIYERVSAAIEQAIDHHRIPTVYVNTCRHDIANAINMDEAGAIRTAVLQLVSLGRHRPVLIQLSAGGPLEDERTLAMREICREAHLAEPFILTVLDVSAQRERSLATIQDFIIANPACDSLLVPHAAIAGLVYKACRRIGRRIPEDIAVISMQDSELLLDFEPQVTAFDLPTHDLGAQSVALLNQIIHGKQASRETLLPYGFHIRASSGGTSPDRLNQEVTSDVDATP